jgi:hypothetical protein
MGGWMHGWMEGGTGWINVYMDGAVKEVFIVTKYLF